MTVLFVLGLALACALAFAQRAAAAGPSLLAEGLHISTGAIVDPKNQVWVADHNAGFCRIKPSAEGPGVIDHPQNPGDTESNRTCLGGLLPEAATGPDAAGQPAFVDPSPEFANSGDEFVLIPDGASPSADVVRADWNPDTGLFQFRDTILMNADPTGEDRPRPVAVSVAADGNAYVVFQRSGTIQRIVNPESPNPTVDLVATTSDGRGASAVAATYGDDGPLGPPRIVVAETTGLREVIGTATDQAAPRTTVDSRYDLPAGAVAVSALTYEVVNPTLGTGDLFAGTADSLPAAEGGDPNADEVYRWDGAGQPEPPVARGLSSVGGFGPRHNGGLLVVDDPALVLPDEPLGTGRLHSVDDTWVRITGGPSGPTGDTTPTFEFEGEGTFECRLDNDDWQTCTGTSFTPGTDLTPGDHTFAIRVEDSDLSDARRFHVDTVAPTEAPKILSPANDSHVVHRPDFGPHYDFDPADGETEGDYQCKVTNVTDPDAPVEGTWQDCSEGRQATRDEGKYTLVVRGRDAAGNPATFVDAPAEDASPVSAPVTFTVGNPPLGDDVPDAPNGELPAPDSVVRLADGLHIATGAFEAPDGSVWVTDHNAGLCRVSKPTFDGAGQIEHPQVPGAAGPNTCLGGLLPEARPGADAAGQPVLLDPTPRNAGSGDEVVIVPDGAAPSTSLFRAQWNPGTKRFDPMGQIDGPLDADADEPRPTAVAMGPDPDGPNGDGQPDLFYVRKKDNLIVRIRDAAGQEPIVEVVGQGRSDKGFEAIAVGQRTVTVAEATETEAARTEKRPVIYIAEPNGGLSRLIPAENPPANPPLATAITVPGLASASALAYDKARDLLYAGTADAAADPVLGTPGNPNGDRVHRFKVEGTDGATPSPTLTRVGTEIGQFNMIGGLSVRPSGHVLVTDDIALTLPDEPLGTGRLYQVGSPTAHIAEGPTGPEGQALDASFTSDSSPQFKVTGDGPFECVVRPDGTPAEETDWAPCADNETGTVDVGTLADDTYVLSVRSTRGAATETQNDTSLYVPESLRFTVDTDDPGEPNVTVAKLGTKSNASPWFTFTPASPDKSSDVEWRCRLNDADEFTACHPGRTFPLRENGSSQLEESNTVEVKAVDKAGNESSAHSMSWDADTTIPQVTITSPGAAGQDPVRQRETSVTLRLDVQDGDAPAAARTGCRIDGAPWKECDRTGETFTGLTEGTHVLKAHARDAFGNMSPTVSRRVIVDTTGPQIAINGVAGVTGPSVTATFSVANGSLGEGEGATRFFCSLDGATATECQAALSLSGLSNGQHTLVVYGQDDVGNRGTSQTITWTVAGAPSADSPVDTGVTGGGAQGGTQGGVAGTQNRALGAVTLRLAPTIQAATLRTQGLPVTVRPQAGATTVRIRVFRVGGVQGRAAAVSAKSGRKLVATVYRATPKAKTYRFRLKERKLRALKPGRYVVEVRAGKSRTRLGAASTKTLVVRGR